MEFNERMVMQIMPKLIITHLVSLAEEKQHCSIIAIRRLINFIRVFNLLLDMCPSLMVQVNLQIETFLKDVKQRHKDFTPSLGDLLVYVIVSDKYKMSDILD